MVELLKYVKEEWHVVSQAPLIFIILALLIGGTGYFLAKWRYTTTLKQSKATNENLQQQVSYLNQKCDDLSEDSPDILLRRNVDRNKLLEEELVLVDDELASVKANEKVALTELEQARNANEKQRQEFTAKWMAAYKQFANLEAQKQYLQRRMREIEEPYLRFLYHRQSRIQTSPGRQSIVTNVIKYLGVENVLDMSPNELVEAFSTISAAVSVGSKEMFSKTGLNGGGLTGLRSVGIVDSHNQLTHIGISVFKSTAKEMKANSAASGDRS